MVHSKVLIKILNRIRKVVHSRHWKYPFFENIISYPLSRPKKWYNIISYITAKKRIGYYILYTYLQKFRKITLFLKKIFFGKVTKELFWILSIYICSLKEDIHNLFLYLTKKMHFVRQKYPKIVSFFQKRI
jgi:hypothetical protein